MPDLSTADQLSPLPKLQKPALHELWRSLFDTDAPKDMRKGFLVQFLAYRIQEQKFGGLSDHSQRRLRELANSIEVSASTSGSRIQVIKPGTRLIRQWKGQVHVVNAEENSYEYRGARYESLSEIARLITGTRWSGPLFFGLKNKQGTNAKEVA